MSLKYSHLLTHREAHFHLNLENIRLERCSTSFIHKCSLKCIVQGPVVQSWTSAWVKNITVLVCIFLHVCSFQKSKTKTPIDPVKITENIFSSL